MGEWMAVNSEAIYGTSQNPWPYEFSWGRVTVKDGKLYLLFYEWPGEFRLHGLRNKVTRAVVLADPGRELACTQSDAVLTIALPAEAPDPLVSVVAVEFEGALDVDPSIFQQLDGKVALPAYLAALAGDMTLTNAGMVSGWKTPAGHLQWRFKLDAPGTFAVRVVAATGRHNLPAAAGHKVTVSVAGQEVTGVLDTQERVDSPRAEYFPEFVTTVGEVALSQPGEVALTLAADEIGPDAYDGLIAVGVELVPQA